MANRWTKEQKQAIDARGSDLLIAAAAGSGKTAVLVERIITKLLREEQEIDRLLVVTFTNAAASEMRQRIGVAIAKQLEETPEDIHLQNQMAFLPRADIKTIHAFCLQVIREYYHLLELDPKVRTADPAEIKLLQKEVLEELFETLYAAEDSQWFFDLLETFSSSTKDTPLQDLVLQLYTFAEGSPNPKRQLEQLAESLFLAEGETVDACGWFSLIRQSVETALDYARYQLKKAWQMADEGEFGGYHKLLTNEVAMVENFAAALQKKYADWWLAYLAIDFARLPAYRGEEKETAERIKALRNEAKDTIKKLQEAIFAYSPEMQADLVRRMYPVVQGLARLTKLFLDAFAAAKREKNMIDFHDYEHFALEILVNEDGTPTEAAAELRQRYDEIMIDEYQDSNLVQETILAAVSGESIGENNRFMVGDVKQSIYRFRLARPELFLEKYETYTLEDSDCQRIDLKKNFRSRREILAFTNEIFREVMRQNPGKILYTAETALYPGADYPEMDPMTLRPELLLLDLDEDEELMERVRMTPGELEAELTGQRILKMVGKEEIFDKTIGKTGSMRKIEFKDIVILFRSPSAFAESYGKVLENMGIPVYVGTRSGYFSTREVQVVLSLLKIIDNSSQDIPLAAVLLSSIGGFTKKETALIRSSCGEEKAFHESCRWYRENGEDEKLRKKLEDFYALLEDFRQQAAFTPIHELLWYIFDVTGYAEEAAAMPAGEQRAQNLKMLVQKAWDYEKTSYRGLFNFIRYIENLQKYDVDYGEAQSLGENRNVVQIMSIHRSKGLEFPVVFLGGLEKQFNKMDTRSRMVLDADLGIGFDMVDPVLRVRRTTLFKRCIQAKVNDDNIGEEIRVLYVALTRAKEKLILTGAVSGLEKKLERWCQSASPLKYGLSYQILSGAGGYLDLLMPVLLKYESARELLGEKGEIRPLREEEDAVWTTPVAIRKLSVQDLLAGGVEQEARKALDIESLRLLRSDEIYEPEFHEILGKRMAEAEEQHYQRIPVKLTVSQLKRQSEAELETESELLYGEESKKEADWEDWERIFEDSLFKEQTDLKTGTEEALPEVEEIIPDFLKDEAPVQGTARGTAYHIFLQYLDFTRAESLEAVEEQLRELKEKGRLTREEAAAIDCRRILCFSKGALGQRMARAQQAGVLFREQHFIYAIPAARLYPEAEEGRKLLIQGVVDAYFEEADGLILVDYKTDYVEKGGEAVLYRKYAAQLNYYTEALEQLTGRKVKEKILYSVRLQKELREN